MSTPVLSTKLYIPQPRARLVLRSRLVDRLDEGLQRRLTLVSAPAGFGKTTLVSEWVARCAQRAPGIRSAWLSLDEGENEAGRFLVYFIAALQELGFMQAEGRKIGEALLDALQSLQPPPFEFILTALLNEIASIHEQFLLVLDDYHLVGASAVKDILTFLLDHLPPQMHLVIVTREDPALPLARLRARDQLSEIRAADLRFTLSEAAEFLNRVMGLKLSAENIAELEDRTEGWIAGLQLAALALQGAFVEQGSQAGTASPTKQDGLFPQGTIDGQQPGFAQRRQNAGAMIRSFTGSRGPGFHHFIMDYLVEEVLHQQSERVQVFLLFTSILDRMCGPLCDAVLQAHTGTSEDERSRAGQAADGQNTLEYLERANLFIVPLDPERRWYRYHHLFADLLRHRLRLVLEHQVTSPEELEARLNELHLRASQWYEENGFSLEAFRHAAAAHDVDRADRLIEGKGIFLHFVSPVATILSWLESLPKSVLDVRPKLLWRFASLLLIGGRTDGVEEKLQAAETALAVQNSGPDPMPEDDARNLIGQIAAARATLALTRYDVDAMLAQSFRALEYLDPGSLFTRASANWTLGYASLLKGDRAAARRALIESIALSRSSGAVFTLILATIGLGNVQEADNALYQAAETYRTILHLAGEQPQQIIHEAHLGIARISYEWNDLEAAALHGQQSLRLAQQYDVQVIDRFILCEVFLARITLAKGNIAGAAAMLERTAQIVQQRNFTHRMPEVAAAQALVMLKQENIDAAAKIAQNYFLPLLQARIHIARNDPSAALDVLEAYLAQAETRGWHDECLKGRILQAAAWNAAGDTDQALLAIEEALKLAEPGGFVRIFLDEGEPVKRLLVEAASRKIAPEYGKKLLAAFEAEENRAFTQPQTGGLSQREIEILQLIALGLSNQEISQRLVLALDTVKGHNRRIFEKLQVQRRTEAVARARALGLLE